MELTNAQRQEYMRHAAELDHSYCGSSTPIQDDDVIILFMGGPANTKHYHMPNGTEFDPGDIMEITSQGNPEYYLVVGLFFIARGFDNESLARFLLDPEDPEVDLQITMHVCTKHASNREDLIGSLHTDYDMVSESEFVVYTSTVSPVDTSGDKMVYHAPDSESEADKEIREWNEILHGKHTRKK